MTATLTARTLLPAIVAVAAATTWLPFAQAGSASAAFVVTARLASPADASNCAGSGEPLALTCSPTPAAPVSLQPRGDMFTSYIPDGWVALPERNVGYGSVYAASLTTRVIRYEDWEYVETLVSW